MRIFPSYVAFFASLAFLSVGVNAAPGAPTSPVVTLTSRQVTELLSPQKHLDHVSQVIFDAHQPAQSRARVLRGTQIDVDYALYLQQSEAIRTAGELKTVVLLPNLVQFMDYPRDWSGKGVSGLASPDDNTQSGDRRQYPVIDAILTMGQDAVTPLQTLAIDPKAEVTQRVRALYVLHYLNDTASQVTAKTLTAEFEKAGDVATVVRIQAAVSDNPWAKWKAHLAG